MTSKQKQGDERTDFVLRFHPRDPVEEARTLPTTNIVQVLDGMQRTIHLVAMMKEGHIIRERVHISHDIRKRYQLHCRHSIEGSNLLSVFVAGPERGNSYPDEAPQIARLTHQAMKFINTGNEGELRRIIPDSQFLSRILNSLLAVFEDRTGKCALSISDPAGATIARSDSMRKGISRIGEVIDISETRELTTQPTITGLLGKIDFTKRKLSLKILRSEKLISGYYPKKFEKTLLENTKNFIRIEGIIEVDNIGIPSKISHIENIHPVGAEYVDMVEVVPDGLSLTNNDSRGIRIYPSECGEVYHARHEEIGIALATLDLSEILDLIKAFLTVQWREIGMREDSKLSVGGRRKKSMLREIFMAE